MVALSEGKEEENSVVTLQQLQPVFSCLFAWSWFLLTAQDCFDDFSVLLFSGADVQPSKPDVFSCIFLPI